MSMSQSDSIKCTVCRKHRHELRTRKSKLMPSMQLFLCNECFTAKREPKFLVILIARKDGVGAVEEYITKHRYVGDEISALDLV